MRLLFPLSAYLVVAQGAAAVAQEMPTEGEREALPPLAPMVDDSDFSALNPDAPLDPMPDIGVDWPDLDAPLPPLPALPPLEALSAGDSVADGDAVSGDNDVENNGLAVMGPDPTLLPPVLDAATGAEVGATDNAFLGAGASPRP